MDVLPSRSISSYLKVISYLLINKLPDLFDLATVRFCLSVFICFIFWYEILVLSHNCPKELFLP